MRIGEFIAGLGGRDITVDDIEKIFAKLKEGAAEHSEIQWIGLKEH